RGEEVELELGGGGPVAALDDGVEHRAEDVIDEGGYDTSVEGAEGVEEFGPHVELGEHRGGPHFDGSDAEVGRQAIDAASGHGGGGVGVVPVGGDGCGHGASGS